MSGANVAGLVVLGVVVVGAGFYFVTRTPNRPQPMGGLAQTGLQAVPQQSVPQQQTDNTAADISAVVGGIGALSGIASNFYNAIND